MCEIHSGWKRGNLTTISKKREKELLKTYRLINVILVPGKIVEKIYWETLLMYTKNKMNDHRQHGFPKDKISVLLFRATETEPGEGL